MFYLDFEFDTYSVAQADNSRNSLFAEQEVLHRGVTFWNAIVLDIIWFCHDPHFVFKGTEDMVKDYHDYLFHIKGFFIGEGLALIVCAMVGLVVQFLF